MLMEHRATTEMLRHSLNFIALRQGLTLIQRIRVGSVEKHYPKLDEYQHNVVKQ